MPDTPRRRFELGPSPPEVPHLVAGLGIAALVAEPGAGFIRLHRGWPDPAGNSQGAEPHARSCRPMQEGCLRSQGGRRSAFAVSRSEPGFERRDIRRRRPPGAGGRGRPARPGAANCELSRAPPRPASFFICSRYRPFYRIPRPRFAAQREGCGRGIGRQ